MLSVEWDEKKRLSTLAARRLDFADAVVVFSNAHLISAARTVGGEARCLCVGMLEDVYVTIIYTMRGNTVRIVSMRRARHDEKAHHQKVYRR